MARLVIKAINATASSIVLANKYKQMKNKPKQPHQVLQQPQQALLKQLKNNILPILRQL